MIEDCSDTYGEKRLPFLFTASRVWRWVPTTHRRYTIEKNRAGCTPGCCWSCVFSTACSGSRCQYSLRWFDSGPHRIASIPRAPHFQADQFFLRFFSALTTVTPGCFSPNLLCISQFCPRGSDFTVASLFPCGGLGGVDLITGDDCVVSSDAKVTVYW